MTVNKIMSVGYQSAEIHLALAEQKGMNVIQYKLLQDPRHLGNGVVELPFEYEVPKPASLCYRVNGQPLPEFGVIFLSYDKRTRTVRLKDPTGAFEGVKAENVLAECSLRYLIERVRDFYHDSEGIHLPNPTVPPSAAVLSENCSEEQVSAILTALSAPLCFIQGGPGCGKSRMVLASCVTSELCDERKILLVGPTNFAVDVALVGVLDALGVDAQEAGVLRLGNPTNHLLSRYPEVIEDYDAAKRYKEIRNQLATDEDLDEVTVAALKYELDALTPRLTANRIRTVSIVAATTDTFLARFTGVYALEFSPDHIYLDEAAYCPLIKALPLLTMEASRLTLLGDVHQLPPVSQLRDEEIRQNLELVLWTRPAVLLGAVFSDSLHDLYFRNGISNLPYTDIRYLTQSFRYGWMLGSVLGEHVYNGQLCGICEEGTEIIVLDAPARGVMRKRTSLPEVNAIGQYLASVHPENCAILTPYCNQASMLREHLPPKWRNSVKTIHSTQGQEWDTVILSVVDNRNMFYTDSKNRDAHGLEVINTAVSRVKRRLVIVCDESFWLVQEGQLIQRLIAIANTSYRNHTA